MPRDIQEQVARNRQERRALGVRVYSPTRTLSNPRANAGTASRILGGPVQQPQQRQGMPGRFNVTPPPPQGAVEGYQPPPMQTTSYLDQLVAARRSGQLQSPEPEQESGFGGLFGGALGTVVNPVGRVLGGAMEAMQYPRRIVQSTVQELGDLVDPRQGTSASFDEWLSQVRDPTFGFGSMVGDVFPDDELWGRTLNRGVGLVGDVLMDPFTYVGGSAVLSGTGRQMRVGAAAEAIANNLGDDIASRLGRRGVSALSNQERQLLRQAGSTVLDRGYYFRAPFTKTRVRLPGTGALEQGISGAFSGARERLAATRLGTALRSRRYEEGYEEAIEKLVTGRGTMGVTEAATILNFGNARRRVAGLTANQLNVGVQRLIDQYGPDGLNSLIHQTETLGNTPLNDLLNTVADMYEAVGGVFPRGRRQAYFPHIYTDGGLEWLTATAEGKAFREAFFKDIPLDEFSPHLLQRAFVPRDDPYMIGGRAVKRTVDGKKVTTYEGGIPFYVKGAGTIDDINAEFALRFPDAKFKLLDDDASTVMARYIESMSDDIGKLGAWQELANSKSALVRRLSEEGPGRWSIDAAETELRHGQMGDALRAELREAQQMVTDIHAETIKGVTGIQGVLGVHLRRTLDDLRTVSDETKARLDDLFVREQELSAARGVKRPDVPSDSPIIQEFEAALAAVERDFGEKSVRLTELRELADRQRREYMRELRASKSRARVSDIPKKFAAFAEYNRLRLELAQIAADRESLDVLRQRLLANRAAGEFLVDRAHDESFLNLALAADETPPPTVAEAVAGEVRRAGGPTGAQRVTGVAPIYDNPSRSPEAIHKRYEALKEAVIGRSPEARELGIQIGNKIDEVGVAQRRLNEAASIHQVDAGAAEMTVTHWRQIEADLKAQIDETRAYPGLYERRLALEEQLRNLQDEDGELVRAIANYNEARAPIERARVEVLRKQGELYDLRRQQTALVQRQAEQGPIEVQLPLSVQEERVVRNELADLRRRRSNLVARNSKVRRSVAARRELDRIDNEMKRLRSQLDTATVGGDAAFRIDSDGNVVPRRGVSSEKVFRLTEQRDEAQRALRRIEEEHKVAKADLDQHAQQQATAREAMERDVIEYDEPTPGQPYRKGRLVRAGQPYVEPREARVRRLELVRKLDEIEARRLKTRQRLSSLNDELGTPEQAARTSRQAERLAQMNRQYQQLQDRRLAAEHAWGRGRRELDEVDEQIARRTNALNDQARARETYERLVRQRTERARRSQRRQRLDPEAEIRRLNAAEQAELAKARPDGYRYEWADVEPLPPQRYVHAAWEEHIDDPVLRDAVRSVREIEGRRDLTKLREASPLNEIDDALARIKAARGPMDASDINKLPQYQQLLEELKTRGGDNTTIGRARAAAEEVRRVVGEQGDLLESSGALSSERINWLVKQRITLDTKLDLHQRYPNPALRMEIDQMSADLARWAGFMRRYQAVIEGGVQPSDQLSALLVVQELNAERDVLIEQLRKADRLLSRNPDADALAQSIYDNNIRKYKDRIETEKANISAMQEAYEQTGVIDHDELRRAKQRLGAADRALSKVRRPDFGTMNEDIDMITDHIIREWIEVDNAINGYNEARRAPDELRWPVQRRIELEAQIPRLDGELATMKESQRRLLAAINKAEREGRDVVRYKPWRQEISEYHVDEAQRMLDEGEVPDYLVPSFRRQVAAARQTRSQTVKLNIYEGPGPKTGITQMPLVEARQLHFTNQQSLDNISHYLADKQLKLSVLNGKGVVERNQLEVLLGDLGWNKVQTPDGKGMEWVQGVPEPLDAATLQQINDQIASISSQMGPPSPEQRALMQFNELRIKAQGEELGVDQIEEMKGKLDQLDEEIEKYTMMLQGDTTYMQAVIDGGHDFFRELIEGRRPITEKDLRVFQGLLGGERGLHAARYIDTINKALDDFRLSRQGLSRPMVGPEEMEQLMLYLRSTLGESRFGETVMDRILSSAGMEATPEQLLVSEGQVAAEMREALFNSMIAAANSTKQTAMRDFSSMLEVLGFRFGTGPDNVGKFQALGINLSRQTMDFDTLRSFVAGQLQRIGYDPGRGLVERAAELRSRLARVNMMRRGLGANMNMWHFKSPEESFRRIESHFGIDRLARMFDPDNAADIVASARTFEELIVPDDALAVFDSQLQRARESLLEAIKRGDGEAIDRYQGQIDTMIAGGRPNITAPAPGAAAAPDLGPERARLVQARDEAAARAQEIDQQMKALRPAEAAPPTPEAGGLFEDVPVHVKETIRSIDVEELSPSAQALVEYARTGPQAPGDLFSQAEINTAFKMMDDLIEAKLPTAQIQDEIRRMQNSSWGDEAAESVARANELYRESIGTTGGFNTATAAEPPELAALRSQLAEANAARQAAEDALNQFEQQAALPAGPAADQLAVRAEPDVTPDRLLDYDTLQGEYADARDELDGLLNQYGGINNAPEEVQMLMGQLVGRMKTLAKLSNSAANQESLLQIPGYSQYINSRLFREQPAISFDWENVMTLGTPSASIARQMGDSQLAKALGSFSGARALPSGPVTRGSLTSQQAALTARRAPVEQLQETLTQGAGRAQEAAAGLEGQIADIEGRVAQVPEMEAQRAAALQRTTETPPPADLMDRTTPLGQARTEFSETLAEIDSTVDALKQLDMQRWAAEDAYSAKLDEIDMDLSDTRQKLVAASRDNDAFEQQYETYRNALEQIPRTSDEMRTIIDDMAEVNKWRTIDAPEREGTISQVEAMLQSAGEAQQKLVDAELTEATIAKRLKQFQEAPPADVLKRVVADGWRPVMSSKMVADMEPDDVIVLAQTLSRALDNVVKAARKEDTWRLVEKYTAFFKTYATAKPGFHVRNAMSAIFMNLVDNVPVRTMARALPLWRAFMKDPQGFLAQADDATRQAFSVVFGSGAAGQYMEYGVGTASATASKAYQRIMNNAFTRWNRRMGAHVEGSIRLGMALDSIERGMSPHAALERVSKYHFNYTEVSSFDRKAKRYIPFWTFMSRNLPLQIEQMFLRPKMYLAYQNLVRNFGQPLDPLTPDYWISQGAFTLDEDAENREAPWYLAPDLPHLRVTEPLDALARGEVGKALLSDINPLFMAPLEAFAIGKKMYSGAPLEKRYRDTAAPMDALMPLLGLIRGTEYGDSGTRLVDERYAHVARSTLPPLDFLERIFDQTGTRAGRQDETLYRALGAPVYQLTDELRESTQNREYYEQLDERNRRRALARM